MQDNGNWYEILKDLTPIALESGLRRLTQLTSGAKFTEFPPNCLQFRAMCLGFYEELRLPKAMDVYREIKNRAYVSRNTWSHPLVKYIASQLPQNYLEIRYEQDAYRVFEEIYNEICMLLKQGHDLPETKEHLLLVKSPNRKLAQFYLAKMKQQLGVAG